VLRAWHLVTVSLVASIAACGGGDSSAGGGSSSVMLGDGGTPPEPPPDVKTCASDADCPGGKCKDVGSSTKVCVRSQSCTGGSGANATCGGVAGNDQAQGSDDCCQALALPSGSFHQFNQTSYPATVSSFVLDKFEVTAGRFRAFVDATNGDLRGHAPAAGSGAHPKVPSSGWRSEWNAALPGSRTEIDQLLGPERCQVGANLNDYGALTWWTPALDGAVKAQNGGKPDVLAANTKDALDGKPLNCVPWQVLFAFCIWDGGRLPTNAEWGYAAAGGAEQREFAWGTMADGQKAHVFGQPNLSFAPLDPSGQSIVVAWLWDQSAGPNAAPPSQTGYVYTWGSRFASPHDNASHVAPVGRRVSGNAKWGHADMSGGIYEWTLDEGPIRPGTCADCANVSWPAPSQWDANAIEGIPDFQHKWFQGGARSIRGGAWDNALGLSNTQTQDEIDTYTSYPVLRTYRSLGGRCARDP
jgi:formylglycine-generating enzyme required for sulfatase activity